MVVFSMDAMTTLAETPPLPARRPELSLGPPDASGQYVVKDPVRRTYYHFGEQEQFLLTQLDGSVSAEALCARFEAKFGEPLSTEDACEFVRMLREWGLLAGAPRTSTTLPAPAADASPADPATRPGGTPDSAAPRPVRTDDSEGGTWLPRLTGGRCSGSVLAVRARLIDPDRIFTWLAPRIAFVWTGAFMLATAGLILFSAGVALANRGEFAAAIPQFFTWEKFFLAWIVLVVATFMHECAHGLTCKRYGGEVHEIGFLFLYFTPCFYCDVSDAWMMPQTRKRLWIMLAGSYCDLIVWAVSILVWRATLPDAVVHDLAWIAASVCGVRIFFNMNPLIKLDGYYLLSDYCHLPNLRQRAWDTTAAQLRRFLWGAPAPALTAADRPGALLVFGVLSWCYSAFLIFMLLYALFHLAYHRWGPASTVLVMLLAGSLIPALFTGIFAGEVRRMVFKRPIRTAVICVMLAGVGALCTWGTMQDTASGPFRLRAARRAEVRAPVTGYLRSVAAAEGARLEQGAPLAVLEVPDLLARLAQKRAEIDEHQVKIRVLLERFPGSKETEALQAHIVSLRAEVTYLEEVAERQKVAAPLAGIVITPRVSEKVGQYLKDGELICELEDPGTFEIEIALPEQDALRVHRGQRVALKARVFPTGSLPAVVTRIAPAASPPMSGVAGAAAPVPVPGAPSTLTVYCTLDLPEGTRAETLSGLRSNMTGHARIDCGTDRIGVVLARRVRHFLRTEFWW